MKTKLFLAAMAAVAVIGCQKEPAGSISAPDGDASFLKVDLRAAGSLTKAGEGTFEYGEETENAVETIHFYFFDSADKAYAVDAGNNNYVTVVTGEGVDWNTTSSADSQYPNVAEISDAVLVIKQSKQAPPAKMVVVLNAPTIAAATLADLRAEISTLTNTNGYFIMSNSVYVEGGAVVDATPIMSENIFAANHLYRADGTEINVGTVLPDTDVYTEATPSDASKITVKPVDIYVERVAAKVRVSLDNDKVVTIAGSPAIPVMDGKTPAAQVTFGESNVYAKVLGWQITNNTSKAYLLKKVDPSWTEDGLGFTWNASSLYRSYWATTTDEPKHNFTFNQVMGHNPEAGYDYYFENTKGYDAAGNKTDVNNTEGENAFDNELGKNGNQASQLLVAAQLVDKNGNALKIAKWYGVQYTVDALKTAMVATVASKIYVPEGAGYRTIGVGDVVFYQVAQNTEDNRYEVKVTIDPDKTYYSPTSEGAFEADNDGAATLLAGIDPAQMWTTGYTYYYTTIKHFGAAGKDGEYGIVRNHVYDVNIDGVTGFGTPVYDPTHVITPEKPEEDVALNLSARINILAWHLVSQDVTLGM